MPHWLPSLWLINPLEGGTNKRTPTQQGIMGLGTDLTVEAFDRTSPSGFHPFLAIATVRSAWKAMTTLVNPSPA